MYVNDPTTVKMATMSIATAKKPPNASSESTSSEKIAEAGISPYRNSYPT